MFSSLLLTFSLNGTLLSPLSINNSSLSLLPLPPAPPSFLSSSSLLTHGYLLTSTSLGGSLSLYNGSSLLLCQNVSAPPPVRKDPNALEWWYSTETVVKGHGIEPGVVKGHGIEPGVVKGSVDSPGYGDSLPTLLRLVQSGSPAHRYSSISVVDATLSTVSLCAARPVYSGPELVNRTSCLSAHRSTGMVAAVSDGMYLTLIDGHYMRTSHVKIANSTDSDAACVGIGWDQHADDTVYVWYHESEHHHTVLRVNTTSMEAAPTPAASFVSDLHRPAGGFAFDSDNKRFMRGHQDKKYGIVYTAVSVSTGAVWEFPAAEGTPASVGIFASP